MNVNEKRIAAMRLIDTGKVGFVDVGIRRDDGGEWYLTTAGDIDFTVPVKIRTKTGARVYTPLSASEMSLDMGPYVGAISLVRVSVGDRILSAADKRRVAARFGLGEVWDGDQPTYIER